MRTLISLNGWWGFFFMQNMQILTFIPIFMAILVTDRGDAPDYSNDQLVKRLYGRVLPIHLERASLRGDSYLD